MELSVGFPIMLGAGLLLFTGLFALRLRREALPPSLAVRAAAAGIIFAFLCGKAVFLLFNTHLLSTDGLISLVRLNPEEFSFTGCCFGFWLGAVCIRRWGYPSLGDSGKTLDCMAVPFLLLIALARAAELFAGELGLAEFSALGLEEIEDGSLLARFPLAVRDDFGTWFLAVCTLEAVLILLIALCLRIAEGRNRKKGEARPGALFETGVYCVCGIRLFLELARMASPVFYFVHVEQVFCAIVMLVLLIRLYRSSVQGKKTYGIPVVLFFLCIAVNGLAQYVMDKPWKFESMLPEETYLALNENLQAFGLITMLATVVLLFALYFAGVVRRRKNSAQRQP